MEKITIDKSNIDILIQNLVNEKLHDSIDIESVSNLFNIIEKNNPIPIEYYTKNLTELTKITDKKCDIKICKRDALYVDDQKKYYCWIHCQLNN